MYGLNMSEKDKATLQKAQTDIGSKDATASAAGYASQAEVLRNNGIVIPTGDAGANVVPGTPLPKSWENKGSGGSSSGGGGSSAPKGVSSATTTKNTMSMLAVQQNQAAQEQIKKQADYAVEQGVKELERAEADAQKQFQTQQNQVDIDEAKALDNQALYAEARGDRGGIGQDQYGQIQNTAMNNRRAINTARTELSTNTARQIADLRAQGEFKKADALLQQAQVFLGQLMEIQKWGAEFTMQEAQFNAQLEQWKAEFDLKASEITGTYNGQMTWSARQAKAEAAMALLEAGYTLSEDQLNDIMNVYHIDRDTAMAIAAEAVANKDKKANAEVVEIAIALAQSGIDLNEAQMAALEKAGYDRAQIQQIIKAARTPKTTGGGGGTPTAPSNIYQQLYDAGYRTEGEAYAALLAQGYTATEAENLRDYYMDWLDANGDGPVDPGADGNGADYPAAKSRIDRFIKSYGPAEAFEKAMGFLKNGSFNDLTDAGNTALANYIAQQTGYDPYVWFSTGSISAAKIS